uniref:Uncharacterized protein n=1 Tax=Glossina pallidipes TaxID=7398 RepID=A0A1A9ZUM1_GLOPL
MCKCNDLTCHSFSSTLWIVLIFLPNSKVSGLERSVSANPSGTLKLDLSNQHYRTFKYKQSSEPHILPVIKSYCTDLSLCVVQSLIPSQGVGRWGALNLNSPSGG